MSEIKIDVNKLKGKSFMVATPMYGGMANTMYVTSLLRLQDQANQLGIKMEHCFMMNESLIDRARNGLVASFFEVSKADYLLFIDADIMFRPEDVFALMSYDKDIICAPYPKKHINWPVIAEAIKAGIDDVQVLERLVGEYVFTILEPSDGIDEIVKVSEAGTGFMLVKRSVFDKMREAYPENRYISDSVQDVQAGKQREMHAFFRTGIFDNRYLSEDYYFCHKWREMGGDVWLFPWAVTSHMGTYGFNGSIGTYLDVVRQIQEQKTGVIKAEEVPLGEQKVWKSE